MSNNMYIAALKAQVDSLRARMVAVDKMARSNLYESFPYRIEWNILSEQVDSLEVTIKNAEAELTEPKVWLLFSENNDNRNGKDFCAAFVGLPTYEQISDWLTLTREDYTQLVTAGECKPTYCEYYLEEQE